MQCAASGLLPSTEFLLLRHCTAWKLPSHRASLVLPTGWDRGIVSVPYHAARASHHRSCSGSCTPVRLQCVAFGGATWLQCAALGYLPSTEFLLLRNCTAWPLQYFAELQWSYRQAGIMALSRLHIMQCRPCIIVHAQAAGSLVTEDQPLAAARPALLAHLRGCSVLHLVCRVGAVCCIGQFAFDRVPIAEELRCLEIAVVRRASMVLPTGWHHWLVVSLPS